MIAKGKQLKKIRNTQTRNFSAVWHTAAILKKKVLLMDGRIDGWMHGCMQRHKDKKISNRAENVAQLLDCLPSL